MGSPAKVCVAFLGLTLLPLWVRSARVELLWVHAMNSAKLAMARVFKGLVPSRALG